MKKLSLFIFSLFFSLTIISQAVNYEIEIVHFRMTGCSDTDGIDGDEDPTWKIWGRDNDGVPSFTGGTCYHDESDIPITYIPGGTLAIYPTQMNSNATTLQFQLEAWEEDGGSVGCDSDNCIFTDCSAWWLNSDDDHQLYSSGVYNFRDSAACEWHTISLSAGCFTWSARFRWEYATFDAGALVQDACGDSIVLSAQGSGQWAILSGGAGGFSDNLDPNATFGGVVGNIYTIQWSTLPDCITPLTEDIQINLNSLPDPNLSTSTTVFCEFSTSNFFASNGVTYDWCVNSTSNIIHNDTTIGAFDLINTSLNDSVVYVFATDANSCIGVDSISIEVELSPTVNLGNDTSICDGGYLFLEANDGVAFTGYSWNTTATTSGIDVTAPGQFIVVLTHTNSCTNSDTINISQYNPVNFNLTDVELMCLGDSVIVDAGSGFLSYLWGDGDTIQTNTFYNFGNFVVTVSDTNNCVASDSVTISPNYFYYTIGSDTTISLGATIDLIANPGANYSWNTTDTTQIISVSPTGNTVYISTTELSNGCFEVGTINVLIDEALNIFIPNMFSPNGDEHNDVFKVYGFGIADVSFNLFNRWGVMVWSTSDVSELQTVGWDGKHNGEDQPTGTYVWTISGTTITGLPVTFDMKNKGTLLLRR